VLETIGDKAAFAQWFGKFTSLPKYPDMDWSPEEPFSTDELRELMASRAALCRNPASRFAFIRQPDDAVLLFVDGECFECTGKDAAFAQALCAAPEAVFPPHTASEGLIAALINQGSLAFEEAE